MHLALSWHLGLDFAFLVFQPFQFEGLESMPYHLGQHMGCSQNYVPLLVVGYITAPHI